LGKNLHEHQFDKAQGSLFQHRRLVAEIYTNSDYFIIHLIQEKNMKLKLILAATTALTMIGAPSAQASLVNYNVQETFYEPAYGGAQNTVFNGTFIYNTVSQSITNLIGTLSEAMTGMANGGVQKLLNLAFDPVASKSDGLGGVIAHSFLLNTTSIFDPMGGGYDTTAAMKATGIANAYVTIDVSAAQLSGANQMLAASDFTKLFYGDCQPGGMMGTMCMTGFGTAATATGSMGGYVLSEKVWAAPVAPAAVPLPPVAWTFLSGMIGLLFVGKQRKTI
jgi:hypothetical protein